MATRVMFGSVGVRRTFYFGLSLFITLIVLVGFWPSYFGALMGGGVDRPLIIHFHATIYVGWLMIFIAQTSFAATGRISSHMKLGKFAIGYGVLMVFVGLMAAFGMFAIRVRAGQIAEAQSALISPVLDMIVFAPFLAAAIYFRRVPELHKRLMIVATTALLIAAVGRMQFLGSPRNLWLVFFIWISPILLAMGYDFVRRRIVHPVYVLGIIVLALESNAVRVRIRQTEVWLDMTGWLARVVSS